MNAINSSIIGFVAVWTIANCTPTVSGNYALNNSLREEGIMLESTSNINDVNLNSIPLGYNDIRIDSMHLKKSCLENEAIGMFGEMRMLTSDEIKQREDMYDKMSISTGENFFDFI